MREMKSNNECALIDLKENNLLVRQDSTTSSKNQKIQNINKVHIDIPVTTTENQKQTIDL